jgi:transmembrane sensor
MSRDAKSSGAAPGADDMSAMTLATEYTPQATVEAVDWMIRLTSDEAGEEDMHALDRWRQARPENDAAYRALAAIRPVGSALRTESRMSRRALLAGGGMAIATFAALGSVRPPLGLWPSFAELTADHRTGVGQRLAFTPSAGVKVELNSRSSVSLASGGDGIRLIGGESFVHVQRAQGFFIKVQDATVKAARATLNVETLAGGVRVTCVAGQAECDANGANTSITSNQEWRVASDGAITTRRIDAGAAASWRAGILRFDRARLAEVVEQFNRYRSAPILLTDADIGNWPVSGYFYTHDIDAATAQIVQLLQLRIRSLPGNIALIGK